ncbi:uid operon repressor [Escherichia coli]|uniref:Uid operon repressor n=1 Tax=Escherichia coli TaxID=562 RepID=A0A376S9F6_ECOLX|nr:uid operon repressor [Escherichia coli]
MPSKKGEISPDINTAMTSRLLLDLTYGVLADIEAEDLAREASFAQGLRGDDWRYLNRILILSLFPRAGDN